jgi:hypothetical protein
MTTPNCPVTPMHKWLSGLFHNLISLYYTMNTAIHVN